MKLIRKIKNIYDRIINKYDPIISKCNHDNVFAIAGQSAFFIILSAVPLTMFIMSLMHNFNIPLEFVQDALGNFLAANVISQVTDFITDAYNNSVGISFVTLLVTLWSAAQGIHVITNGLNRVYDAYENRNWFFLRLRAMAYTAALFVVILILIVILVLGNTINNLLEPMLSKLPVFVTIIYNMRFLIIFAFLVILFALIYRNFPNLSRAEHKKYRFRCQLPGAFLCAVSWFVLSLAISIYVDDFNGFSIYGGLARLAVIMIWIYFCMICLMICAEINYVYHDTISSHTLKSAFRKLFRINTNS